MLRSKMEEPDLVDQYAKIFMKDKMLAVWAHLKVLGSQLYYRSQLHPAKSRKLRPSSKPVPWKFRSEFVLALSCHRNSRRNMSKDCRDLKRYEAAITLYSMGVR